MKHIPVWRGQLTHACASLRRSASNWHTSKGGGPDMGAACAAGVASFISALPRCRLDAEPAGCGRVSTQVQRVDGRDWWGRRV